MNALHTIAQKNALTYRKKMLHWRDMRRKFLIYLCVSILRVKRMPEPISQKKDTPLRT